MFDIIIIGGGPAGTTTGTLLQRQGYKTCIIDSKVFPREKLCAGVLTPKSISCIEQVFEGLDLAKLQLQELCHINFFYNDNALGSFKLQSPFRAANRSIMDYELLKYYQSVGGKVYQGQRDYKIQYDKNQMILADGTTLDYKVLVGADGINSHVRRFVDSGWKTAFFCFETYIPNVDKEETIQIYFTRKTKGYYWRIPGKERIAIGLASAYKVGDKDCIDNYKDFFHKQGIKDLSNVKGYFYSYGDYVKKPVKDNVILVGDAAGLIDAITGEGLYYALESGHQAGLFIVDYLEQKESLDKYAARLKEIHAGIDQQKLYNKFIYAPFVKDMGFKYMKEHPDKVQRVLDRVIARGDRLRKD